MKREQLNCSREELIQKITKRVIALIHGKEWYEANVIEWKKHMAPFPITLSRLLEALDKKGEVICERKKRFNGEFIFNYKLIELISENWKLLREDKSTATLEDQEDETLEKIFDLIK